MNAGDYEWWTWTCGLCSVWLQGGPPALSAHLRTCHPDEPNPPWLPDPHTPERMAWAIGF